MSIKYIWYDFQYISGLRILFINIKHYWFFKQPPKKKQIHKNNEILKLNLNPNFFVIKNTHFDLLFL